MHKARGWVGGCPYALSVCVCAFLTCGNCAGNQIILFIYVIALNIFFLFRSIWYHIGLISASECVCHFIKAEKAGRVGRIPQPEWRKHIFRNSEFETPMRTAALSKICRMYIGFQIVGEWAVLGT